MAEVSKLLKIARAVSGDDSFRMRVEAATWGTNPPVEFTEDVLRRVAAAVADQIVLTGEDCLVVDTSEVTDDQILSAVTAGP